MPIVTIILTDLDQGGLSIVSRPNAEELGARYDAGAASPAQQVALMAMAHMAGHTDGMKQPESPIVIASFIPKLELVR